MFREPFDEGESRQFIKQPARIPGCLIEERS
jgi:hypothetical protein